jgi:hypothetical protein
VARRGKPGGWGLRHPAGPAAPSPRLPTAFPSSCRPSCPDEGTPPPLARAQDGTGASLAHLDACIAETTAAGASRLPARVERELAALPPRVRDGVARRTPASIVQAAARLLAGAPVAAGAVPVASEVRLRARRPPLALPLPPLSRLLACSSSLQPPALHVPRVPRAAPPSQGPDVLEGVDGRLINNAWDYISPQARTALLHLARGAAAAAAAATGPEVAIASFGPGPGAVSAYGPAGFGSGALGPPVYAPAGPAGGGGGSGTSSVRSSAQWNLRGESASNDSTVDAPWVVAGGGGSGSAPGPAPGLGSADSGGGGVPPVARGAFGSVLAPAAGGGSATGGRPGTAGSRGSSSLTAGRRRGAAAPALAVPSPEDMALGSGQGVADAAFCLLTALEIQQLGQQVTFGVPRRARARRGRATRSGRGSAASSGRGLARFGPDAKPASVAADATTEVAATPADALALGLAERPSAEAAAVAAAADEAAQAVAAAAAAAPRAAALCPPSPLVVRSAAVAAAAVEWEPASGAGDSTPGSSSGSSFAFAPKPLGRAATLPAERAPSGSLPEPAAVPVTAPALRRAAGASVSSATRFLLVMGAGGGGAHASMVPGAGAPASDAESSPRAFPGASAGSGLFRLGSGSGAGTPVVRTASAGAGAGAPFVRSGSGSDAGSGLPLASLRSSSFPSRDASPLRAGSFTRAAALAAAAAAAASSAGAPVSDAAARALIRAASSAARAGAEDRARIAQAVVQLMHASRSGANSPVPGSGAATPPGASEDLPSSPDPTPRSPLGRRGAAGATGGAPGSPAAGGGGDSPRPHPGRLAAAVATVEAIPRATPMTPAAAAAAVGRAAAATAGAAPPDSGSGFATGPGFLSGEVVKSSRHLLPKGWVLQMAAAAGGGAAPPARREASARGLRSGSFSTEILKSSRHLLPKGFVLQMAAGYDAAARAEAAAAAGPRALAPAAAAVAVAETSGGLTRRGSDPALASEPQDINWGAALGRRPSLDGAAGAARGGRVLGAHAARAADGGLLANPSLPAAPHPCCLRPLPLSPPPPPTGLSSFSARYVVLEGAFVPDMDDDEGYLDGAAAGEGFSVGVASDAAAPPPPRTRSGALARTGSGRGSTLARTGSGGASGLSDTGGVAPVVPLGAMAAAARLGLARGGGGGGRSRSGRHLFSGSTLAEEDVQVEVIRPMAGRSFTDAPGSFTAGGWGFGGGRWAGGAGGAPLLGVVHRMSPFGAAGLQAAFEEGDEEEEDEEEDEGSEDEEDADDEGTQDATTTTAEDGATDDDGSVLLWETGTGWATPGGGGGGTTTATESEGGLDEVQSLHQLLPPSAAPSVAGSASRWSRGGGGGRGGGAGGAGAALSFCLIDPKVLQRHAARAASAAVFALGVHDAVTKGRRQSWRTVSLRRAQRKKQLAQRGPGPVGEAAEGGGGHVAVDLDRTRSSGAAAAAAARHRRRRRAQDTGAPPKKGAEGAPPPPPPLDAASLWARLPLRRRAAYHLHIFLRTVWLAIMGDPSFWQDAMDIVGPRPAGGACAAALRFHLVRAWLLFLKLLAVMSQVDSGRAP